MRPRSGGPAIPCIVEVGEAPVATYLAQVESARPEVVRMQGCGRHVGKTCWVALVLETEFGYRQRTIALERVADGPSQDRASITILLEVAHHAQTEEPQGLQQARDRL